VTFRELRNWRVGVSGDDRLVHVQLHDGDGAYRYELAPLIRAGGEPA
jgi:hypothetical protein